MIKRMSKFTALLLSALMILSVIATGLTSAVAAEVILCVQSKQFFSLLLIDNLHYIQEDERKNVVSHLIFLHRQRELKEPAVYRFDFRVMKRRCRQNRHRPSLARPNKRSGRSSALPYPPVSKALLL
ncbi:surface glycoprotein [Ruminococcus sp.]|uniref:surface glycoprotein n=1 Tax=Ruminococcus sp. TaxID=41978 RepID=UPI002E782A40|nr:surface glycoprotein [Ruminococcus sp.]MEE1264388.1 surface glycoprotein [Ruminococcus sp.]